MTINRWCKRKRLDTVHCRCIVLYTRLELRVPRWSSTNQIKIITRTEDGRVNVYHLLYAPRSDHMKLKQMERRKNRKCEEYVAYLSPPPPLFSLFGVVAVIVALSRWNQFYLIPIPGPGWWIYVCDNNRARGTYCFCPVILVLLATVAAAAAADIGGLFFVRILSSIFASTVPLSSHKMCPIILLSLPNGLLHYINDVFNAYQPKMSSK